MLTNIGYFDFSLKHKETLLDKYYFIDEVIINDSSNRILSNCKELDATIENYVIEKDKYSNLHQDVPEEKIDEIITKIIFLLEQDYMNLTAFAQSFSLFDSSFSSYSILSKKDKMYFLNEILDAFVSTRFDIYKTLGYGYLQILYDSHSHKRMGAAGAKKVSSQLNSNRFTQVYTNDLSNGQYFLPDQIKKDKYLEFLKKNGIKCAWTDAKQDKMPDAVFKFNGTIYIVEHKHLKEGGGGQDKQLSEIVDLISNSEEGVSYIAYMDGLYFNALINPKLNTKMFKTKKDVLKYLSLNSNNYFLNTLGFEKFIKDLIK
ncbi:MAG: hypothetical protein ACI35S_09765 [Anaeroplasma sp.]